MCILIKHTFDSSPNLPWKRNGGYLTLPIREHCCSLPIGNPYPAWEGLDWHCLQSHVGNCSKWTFKYLLQCFHDTAICSFFSNLCDCFLFLHRYFSFIFLIKYWGSSGFQTWPKVLSSHLLSYVISFFINLDRHVLGTPRWIQHSPLTNKFPLDISIQWLLDISNISYQKLNIWSPFLPKLLCLTFFLSPTTANYPIQKLPRKSSAIILQLDFYHGICIFTMCVSWVLRWS